MKLNIGIALQNGEQIKYSCSFKVKSSMFGIDEMLDLKVIRKSVRRDKYNNYRNDMKMAWMPLDVQKERTMYFPS